MRHLIASLLLTLMIGDLNAQTKENNYTKTLSRLLIKNDTNELLLIKVKEGFWVTPAVYHADRKNIRESLSDLMSEYGVEITSPKLKAMFFLDVEFNQSTCFRVFYEAKVKSGELRLPEDMAEMKWVSLDEASSMLGFAHITMGLKQIEKNPNQVWGGSFRFYKEDGKLKSDLIEEFYELI